MRVDTHGDAAHANTDAIISAETANHNERFNWEDTESSDSLTAVDRVRIARPIQGRHQVKKCGVEMHGERAEHEPIMGVCGRASNGVQGQSP